MEDCNKLLIKYLEEIKINSSKKDYLKNSRDAVRERIKKYFKDELKENIPDFDTQGSYALRTLINKIEDDYDIDDGVFLKNLPDIKNYWQKTEEVHKWIYDAIKNHTDEKPEDKINCIRLYYKKDYHIDLPIYSIYNNQYFLARKGNEQWIKSSPKEFDEWFFNLLKEKGEQLRSIIIYLKGWNDFNDGDMDIPGVVFTVLVCKNYIANNRDDVSLYETVKNINIYFRTNDNLLRPVNPFENILDTFSQGDINKLKAKFELLEEKISKALNEQNIKESSFIWLEIFGDRFKTIADDDINKSNNETIINTPRSYKNISFYGF